MKRIALTIFTTLISSFSAISQDVKYQGDIEGGIIVTRDFARSQIIAASSHGAFFKSPGLFIGAGAAIGWNCYAQYWRNVFPVFAAIRKDFPINSRLTHFIDLKAGYSFQGNHTATISNSGVDYGFYCHPSIGLRFATSQKCGIFVKLGYAYQSATFSYGYAGDGEWLSGSRRKNSGGFAASVGFSFQ